jgi:hypothetical protein
VSGYHLCNESLRGSLQATIEPAHGNIPCNLFPPVGFLLMWSRMAKEPAGQSTKFGQPESGAQNETTIL